MDDDLILRPGGLTYVHVQAATPSLCYDYPLRSNFLAQLVIPRDLARVEAKRLCAFIETLITADSAGEKP